MPNSVETASDSSSRAFAQSPSPLRLSESHRQHYIQATLAYPGNFHRVVAVFPNTHSSSSSVLKGTRSLVHQRELR